MKPQNKICGMWNLIQIVAHVRQIPTRTLLYVFVRVQHHV